MMSSTKEIVIEAGPNEPPPPYTPMYPDIDKTTGLPIPTDNTAANIAPAVPAPQPVAAHTTIIVQGAPCPKCQTPGSMIQEDNMCAYICCIVMVILCFPIGLLYLFCLPKSKIFRCQRCNYQV